MEKRVQDYGKEILNVVRSNVSPAVLAKRLQDFHENYLEMKKRIRAKLKQNVVTVLTDCF